MRGCGVDWDMVRALHSSGDREWGCSRCHPLKIKVIIRKYGMGVMGVVGNEE